MAWNLIRMWKSGEAPLYGSNNISVTNNAVPAAVGSTLVMLAAVRPSLAEDPVTIAPSDNLGGTWHQAKDAEGNPIYVGAGTSTRYAVFARLNAGGVTTVSLTGGGTATADMTAHVAEFSGGPTAGEPIWVAAGTTRPTGDTWGALQVSVPAGTLVVGGASLGVTNRIFDPPGGGFTSLGDYKSGGRHNIAAYRITDGGGPVGPVWIKTSGSSTSLNTVTAAIVGSTGSQPLVVTASEDQEIFTNQTAEITASVAGGDGAKTYQWTVQSGPAGAFLGSEDTPTAFFEPAGNTGTYVLRCTVTDSTGSAYDEVTVTVSARPRVGVTEASGWATVVGSPTRLGALTDDSLASYVETGPNPVDEVLTVDVPSLEAPTGTAFIMPVELSAVGNGGWITPQIAAGSGWVDGFPLYVVGAPDYYELTWPVAALGEVSWETGFQVRLVADFDDVL